MNDDTLDDLRVAKDEARLAVEAIDRAIVRAEGLEENEVASAVTLLRGEAERHLNIALSKLKPSSGE